jgi:hypothetical protein
MAIRRVSGLTKPFVDACVRLKLEWILRIRLWNFYPAVCWS